MNYTFYGVDVVKLAEKYKTPLYVVSEDKIVEEIRELKKAFDEKYPNAHTHYASKAFLTKDMVRILKDENIGMDVVSGGELFGAVSLNFPMEKIMFHGNGKTSEEIKYALENNIGRFVCDSEMEIKRINKIAIHLNKTAKILIRVTPGIDSDTHKYISTSSEDSKFGVPLSKVEQIVRMTVNLPNIDLTGFHFHVGSQLNNNKSHVMATEIILDTMNKLKIELDFETKDLNLGGGFGVKYTKTDEVKPVSYFIEPMVNMVLDFCNKNNLEVPTLFIEPGRRIVAEAGITLYTIEDIKEIPGVCKYVSVNGGMADNIRPALYEALYEGEVANKINEEKTELVTIAGNCCESGDIIIRDIKLPNVVSGDILMIKTTGAYHYSMASRYNKNPIPPVVIIKDGQERLSVKGETYEDLYRNDLVTNSFITNILKKM